MIGGGDRSALGEHAAPGKPIFRARLRPDASSPRDLIGRSVLAFAGIARPEKFFATLAEIGARVARDTGLSPITTPSRRARSRRCWRKPPTRDLILVTTEKDQVRIAPDHAREMVALPVTLKFEEPRAVARLLAASAISRGAPTAGNRH